MLNLEFPWIFFGSSGPGVQNKQFGWTGLLTYEQGMRGFLPLSGPVNLIFGLWAAWNGSVSERIGVVRGSHRFSGGWT